MKKAILILLFILLSTLFCGCPPIEPYHNSVGFHISEDSDSTWTISASQAESNGDDYFATIDGRPYQLLGDLPVEVVVPQSEELVVGMTSYSRAKLDRVILPQSPIFKNIAIDEITLIENDTVSIPNDSLYSFSWDPVYSDEIISSTDSVEFQKKCNLSLYIDKYPYNVGGYYYNGSYHTGSGNPGYNLTNKLYEEYAMRSFTFYDTTLADIRPIMVRFMYSTRNEYDRGFREYKGVRFNPETIYWIRITEE